MREPQPTAPQHRIPWPGEQHESSHDRPQPPDMPLEGISEEETRADETVSQKQRDKIAEYYKEIKRLEKGGDIYEVFTNNRTYLESIAETYQCVGDSAPLLMRNDSVLKDLLFRMAHDMEKWEGNSQEYPSGADIVFGGFSGRSSLDNIIKKIDEGYAHRIAWRKREINRLNSLLAAIETIVIQLRDHQSEESIRDLADTMKIKLDQGQSTISQLDGIASEIGRRYILYAEEEKEFGGHHHSVLGRHEPIFDAIEDAMKDMNQQPESV